MLACDRVDRRILAVRGWVFGEQVALREGSDCQDSVAFGGVYRQA